MPLRDRLTAVNETVQEMELAANARFFEGKELSQSGYGSASIYLLGYTAEMLLKCAYFRYIGAIPTERVGPLLYASPKDAKKYALGIDHESYHSLLFWRQLLRGRRRQEGRTLAPRIDAPFILCTHRLYRNWWVEMRYRED